MSLLDLNHIEVLRGPQGTLYGAGAMGGVLKYVTNEPDTTELSGKVRVGASATQGRRRRQHVKRRGQRAAQGRRRRVARGRVPRPRGRLRRRASAPRPARTSNSGDTNGGRVALLVEPSARFHVRATARRRRTSQRSNSDYTDIDPATGQPVDGWNEREQVHARAALRCAPAWARSTSSTTSGRRA